jgi:hypothetical protein
MKKAEHPFPATVTKHEASALIDEELAQNGDECETGRRAARPGELGGAVRNFPDAARVRGVNQGSKYVGGGAMSCRCFLFKQL